MLKYVKKIVCSLLVAVLAITQVSYTDAAATNAVAESEAEVILSVSADKTEVKQGDVITLTVSLDKFQSSRSDDVDKTTASGLTIKGKVIHSLECHLSLGDAVYVENSAVKGLYAPIYRESNHSLGIAEVRYGENGTEDYIT